MIGANISICSLESKHDLSDDSKNIFFWARSLVDASLIRGARNVHAVAPSMMTDAPPRRPAGLGGKLAARTGPFVRLPGRRGYSRNGYR